MTPNLVLTRAEAADAVTATALSRQVAAADAAAALTAAHEAREVADVARRRYRALTVDLSQAIVVAQASGWTLHRLAPHAGVSYQRMSQLV